MVQHAQRIRRSTVGSALAAWLSLSPSVAAAHGAPPEAQRIVSADQDGPLVVQLNEGLAFRDGQHFTYLCPSLWGERSTTAGNIHALGDGEITFVVGTDALYALRQGVLDVVPHAPIDASTVVSVVASDAGVFALLLTAAGSELVALHRDGPPLWSASEPWSAVAAREDRLLLARADADGEVAVEVLGGDGQPIERAQVELPGAVSALRISAPGQTGEPVYLSFFDGAQHVLGELTLDGGRYTELVRADATIRVPVRTPDGTTFITEGGQLMRLETSGATPVQGAGGVTCLDRWQTLPYACVGATIHALTSDGLGAPLFQLERLHGPDAERVPAEAEPECGFQWLLFSNDLERSGLSPLNGEDAEAGAAGSGGAPGQLAGSAMSASTQAQDPTSTASARPMEAATGTGGCRMTARAQSAGPSARAWWWPLPLLLLHRARRRRPKRR